MSTLAVTSGKSKGMTKDERFVIFASSLGTVFEWYDFYLYGSLASIIGAQFFSAYPPATRDIFALLAFAAGFLVRPFGAIVFGRVGDIVGRKYTFLVTILIMGLSTFIVGLLPNAATIGIAAPIILIGLRLLQGLALGGEYGGAATYVAEHAPHGKRGYYTSFIQTTATLGLFLSLIVILFTRTILGETEFAAWGWRIPFLLSVVLLGVSVVIRLKLNESPVFQKMKDEGKGSKAPLTEAFANWSNAKLVIIALVGGVMGQGVVWYTGQFYALFFLQSILKVDGYTANLLIAWSLLLGTGFFIVFGVLSDKIGRKPIILGGCLIAALTFFPIFKMITTNANPALEKAIETVKVEVVADPKGCGDLFNPVGTRVFTAPCDTARAYLSQQSVKYSTTYGAAGSGVKVRRQWQGCALHGSGIESAGAGGGAGCRLPEGRRRADREDVESVRHLPSAGRCRYRTAVHPGALRHDGLRADRGDAGRTVPDQDPLHLDVAALSYRQRLVRRIAAGDRLRDRGLDRRYLRRPLVSDHLRVDHRRRRVLLPARDQGRRHHQVGFGRAPQAPAPSPHDKPAAKSFAAGFAFSGLNPWRRRIAARPRAGAAARDARRGRSPATFPTRAHGPAPGHAARLR